MINNKNFALLIAFAACMAGSSLLVAVTRRRRHNPNLEQKSSMKITGLPPRCTAQP